MEELKDKVSYCAMVLYGVVVVVVSDRLSSLFDFVGSGGGGGAVLYNPSSLNPQDDSWITEEIEPIPIGRTFPGITCASVDERISHRLCIWLGETVGGGEESQIGRNDGLLKAIMSIAGVSDFVRNTKVETTNSKRPDFTALYSGVPIMIDEEKSMDNIQGAVDDVVNKFVWIPNLRALPFFVGFAFSFNQIRIVKLVRDSPYVILFAGNCSSTEDRYAVLKPAINVARVLKYFINSNMIHPAGLSMGQWHQRPCGKSIKLSHVGVQVTCPNMIKFQFLKEFYQKCGQVPFLERLSEADNKKLRLTLVPLGLSHKPTTVVQFRRAIICIATALFALHELGYVHTDIRWSNIVLLNNDDWMLIDCYEVCLLSDNAALMSCAAARNVTTHAWGVHDDLLQLSQLCRDQASDFGNLIELGNLIAAEGTTLANITEVCNS